MHMQKRTGVDYYEVIAHLLTDIQTSSLGLNTHELKKDLKKILKRSSNEGSEFFTKTLPAYGKRIDYSLTTGKPLDCTGFRKETGADWPKLFGSILKQVFTPDGAVREDCNSQCIKILRTLSYLFYKYEVPHDSTQENTVIDGFLQNEVEMHIYNHRLLNTHRVDVSITGRLQPSWLSHDQVLSERRSWLAQHIAEHHQHVCASEETVAQMNGVARNHHLAPLGANDYYVSDDVSSLLAGMQKLANRLFSSCSFEHILPHHGPGVVSTGEKDEQKFAFSRYHGSMEQYFPHTRYFVSSVCDDSASWKHIESLATEQPHARIIFVPKDSRGPRLISAEPLENQYIQQGIKDILVKYIESHPIMGGHVNFTDQTINQRLAMQGSIDGSYCTLDLKDASDRIAYGVVALTFPEHLLGPLMCCRTTHTRLPKDDRAYPLGKFAPMGSALCFPILAATVWLCLTASGTNGACSPKTTYVYGDDIIVASHDVANAKARLALVGLKVNEDKSCTTGFFRESCGMDAYKGICVTPFRLRKVWSPSPSPDTVVSYIAKANEAHRLGYYKLANFLACLVIRSTPGQRWPYVLAADETELDPAIRNESHFEFLPVDERRFSWDEVDSDALKVSEDFYEKLPLFGDVISLQGDARIPRRIKNYAFRDGFAFLEKQSRIDKRLQKRVYKTMSLEPTKHRSQQEHLNYFRSLVIGAMKQFAGSSVPGPDCRSSNQMVEPPRNALEVIPPLAASVYTHKRASKLVRKWRK